MVILLISFKIITLHILGVIFVVIFVEPKFNNVYNNTDNRNTKEVVYGGKRSWWTGTDKTK